MAAAVGVVVLATWKSSQKILMRKLQCEQNAFSWFFASNYNSSENPGHMCVHLLEAQTKTWRNSPIFS